MPVEKYAFIRVDKRLVGLSLSPSEKLLLSVLIGWVKTNRKKPIGGMVNACYRTTAELAEELELSESGVKKVLSGLENPKEILHGDAFAGPTIRPAMISHFVARTRVYSLLHPTLLEIAGVSEAEVHSSHELVGRRESRKDEQGNFYARLNEAKTVEEFNSARDNIGKDLAEFMFAWNVGFKNVTGLSFQWNPRQFGILREYWNGSYRRIRPFDYCRLERFLLTNDEHKMDIGQFMNFDKFTPDKTSGTKSLKHHREDPSSLFREDRQVPESSETPDVPSTFEFETTVTY